MPELVPAEQLAAKASKPYPNDSAEYRQARMRLLAVEIELRRHEERVAAMRRDLPLGGEPKDYRFLDAQGRNLGLGDLFGPHDTLVTYFWMYGPQRQRPCPMCTSLLGSLDQPARDLTQKVALAVIGRSPVARQQAFARERGWQHLAFYSSVGDDFARDYRARARRFGMAGDGCVGQARWPRPPFLGSRDGKHRRPRTGSARGAGYHAAVGHPGSHAWRARHRLVSEAGLRGLSHGVRCGAAGVRRLVDLQRQAPSR